MLLCSRNRMIAVLYVGLLIAKCYHSGILIAPLVFLRFLRSFSFYTLLVFESSHHDKNFVLYFDDRCKEICAWIEVLSFYGFVERTTSGHRLTLAFHQYLKSRL